MQDYDDGAACAGKSFTDPLSGRRLLWSWMHGSVQPLDAAVVNPEVAMDGYMSVPRQVVYSPRLRQLVVTPVAEVEQLRLGARALCPSFCLCGCCD